MTYSDFIIDVTEKDFEYQVIAFSSQVPVVVDFWAEWCAPCRVIGPILEKLAQEAKGGFRLAKVNVDHNPSLAKEYTIRSIPAVKGFREGQVVSEFVGALPEPRIREFIEKLVPDPHSLAIKRGESLLSMGQPGQAEDTFREVLDEAPENQAALLGLTKSLVWQGDFYEAQIYLRKISSGKEYLTAQVLAPLVKALNNQQNNGFVEENPLDMAYLHALRLVRRGNIEAAMDGLLDILRQDKRYRDGTVRLVFLGLLELLGEDNPLSQEYRNELASVLF
jgi:putative thioredoxin